MGKTRRNSPDGEPDYIPVEHRIAKTGPRRPDWPIPRHIGSVVVNIPEPPYKYELPSRDMAGGVPRDRLLDIIQEAGEQLVATRK